MKNYFGTLSTTKNGIELSLLGALGYQVLALSEGVYRLCSPVEPADISIGLLLTTFPVENGHLPLKLFLQPVPKGVKPSAIEGVWRQLDARRMEEDGLIPLELELVVPNRSTILPAAYKRPDVGVRFALELPSGDVACFN